eukprot:12825589-Alexandrium_andersonii.AAC.1
MLARCCRQASPDGSWGPDRPGEAPLHAAARQGHQGVLELTTCHSGGGTRTTALGQQRFRPL